MRSLATLLLLLVAGCVRVKPWQRERLAKPAMETRFGQSGSAHAPGRLCRFVVCAWIPELALASGFGDDWLASARYRFYKQSATHFYEARYANIELLMT